MAQPPHPHTWTTAHLQRLEAEARAVAAEEAPAFAAGLPARFPHVASATYNPGEHRIEVQLHRGHDGTEIGFPVPLAPRE